MNIYFNRIKPLIDLEPNKAEFERKIGIPAHSVNKWNTGKYKSWNDYEVLQKLSRYFLVSSDYMLELSDVKAPSRLSAQDGALLDLFHQLNDEGKSYVLQAADLAVSSGKYIKTADTA